MAISRSDLLKAISRAYEGADVKSLSGSQSFVIDAAPVRELIFSHAYFDIHINGEMAYTAEQLTEDIKTNKKTVKTVRGITLDLM